MSGNHDPTIDVISNTAAAHDAPGRYWYSNIDVNTVALGDDPAAPA